MAGEVVVGVGGGGGRGARGIWCDEACDCGV